MVERDEGPPTTPGSAPDNDEENARTTGERHELYEALRLVGTVGLTVALAIVGCFLLGLYASRTFGGGIWPVVGGTLTGVFLAFAWVYRTFARYANRLPPAPTRAPETKDR
ncbi:MAG: AtpZ/AtpI family protein [Planctomycetota bacterium]